MTEVQNSKTEVAALEVRQKLTIAVNVGFNMLKYGAEINRVEETIFRICVAYGLSNVNVFAIGSNITVTVSGDDGIPRTETKRVLNRDYNLERVNSLNNLSRYICANSPSYEEAFERLHEIQQSPVYPWYAAAAAYAVISFAFALFFGGGWLEGVLAMPVGIAVWAIFFLLSRISSGRFFVIVLSSTVVAYLAKTMGMYLPQLQANKVIIGVLMTLVPGIALTNSMRDFLAGDNLAGLITLTESILTATAVAIGVAIAIALLR